MRGTRFIISKSLSNQPPMFKFYFECKIESLLALLHIPYICFTAEISYNSIHSSMILKVVVKVSCNRHIRFLTVGSVFQSAAQYVAEVVVEVVVEVEVVRARILIGEKSNIKHDRCKSAASNFLCFLDDTFYKIFNVFFETSV